MHFTLLSSITIILGNALNENDKTPKIILA